MTLERFLEIIKNCTIAERYMLTTAILVANGHWDNDDTGMYGNMNEKNISYLANEILDTPYEIW